MKLAHQGRLLLGAVVLSTTVLVILGTLQVRWSRQVGNAAREQVGTTLKAAMLDWHLDLLKQLSAPALFVSTAIHSHESVAHYLEEYDEWARVALHPNLVAGIYVVQRAVRRNPELLRLNLTTRIAEPTEWPSNMKGLRQVLTTPSRLQARSERTHGPPGVRQPTLHNEWLFDPHIPALIYAAGCGDADAIDQKIASNCVIIEFNSQVLENIVLPELAQRYFGTARGLEYQLAVIDDSAKHHAVYTSAANHQEDFTAAAARMNIFGPHRHRDEVTDHPELSASFRPEATISSMQKSSWRDFAAPLWFDVIRYGPTEPDWYLTVKPLQRSVNDAVTEAQHRNLIVAFAVLSVLALSTLTVFVSTQRTQQFARMQLQFISAVSHELRTPLTVMRSTADNLADGIVEGKQQLSQYRAIITSQASQLTALMEQLLNFAATSEHTPQYHLRPLDVSEIIATTLKKTVGLVEEARFEVEQTIESGLPKVMGDLDALSQCLHNLIVNAVKYSRENRWIGLRAALGRRARKTEVQISVVDHGLGIEASDMNRIFEPLYRSPSVKSAQVHGMGLGLSLAANIARSMHGHLSVSSTPGEGSAFTLHLPLAK